MCVYCDILRAAGVLVLGSAYIKSRSPICKSQKKRKNTRVYMHLPTWTSAPRRKNVTHGKPLTLQDSKESCLLSFHLDSRPRQQQYCLVCPFFLDCCFYIPRIEKIKKVGKEVNMKNCNNDGKGRGHSSLAEHMLCMSEGSICSPCHLWLSAGL